MITTVTPRNALKPSIREHIVLPLPPSVEARFEMEIYARFMRHLRNVPNSKMEIKILSAIRFTADMRDVSEALISKTLVDLGLRAPRNAFPCAFLEFCDKMMLRDTLTSGESEHSTPPHVVAALRDHWEESGENRFGPLPMQFAIHNRDFNVSH